MVKQRENNLSGAAADYAAALEIMRTQHALGDQISSQIANGYATVLAGLHRGREARALKAEVNSFRAK